MGVQDPLRDEIGAAATGLIVFNPGPVPVLAEALSCITLIGSGQAVMRLVDGPLGGDSRRRVQF
jgi:hypothetical protein